MAEREDSTDKFGKLGQGQIMKTFKVSIKALFQFHSAKGSH